MIYDAVMVGLTMGQVKYLSWWGTLGTERPLLAVSLLGILLGRPEEGIIMAGSLELIFLGSIMIGGTVPQEYTLGSVFGAAFAMLLGRPLAVAITLAVPLSMLGVLLYNVVKIFFTSLVPRFERLLENKNDSGFLRLWHIFGSVYFFYYFLIGMAGILFGTHIVEQAVNAIPPVVMKSMNVAAKMLPAIGFAMLLVMLWKNQIAVFFFIGFGLAVFIKLPIIGVAFFGICVAVYIALTDQADRKSHDLPKSGGGSLFEKYFFED